MPFVAKVITESLVLMIVVVALFKWVATWSMSSLRIGIIVLSATLVGFVVAVTHGFTERPETDVMTDVRSAP